MGESMRISISVLLFFTSIFNLSLVTADEQFVESNVIVPTAGDLSALVASSRKQHLPILLMFSAEDCEFCDRLEDDVIRPMMISGELSKKTIFRKVMVDSMDKIKDFTGQSVDPDVFAYKKGVQVTPTLQFVDGSGEELVPKLIGYQSVEFFNAYLDSAISGSQEVLSKH